MLTIRLRESVHKVARFMIGAATRSWPLGAKKVDRALPNLTSRLLSPYTDITGYHYFLADLRSRGVFALPGDILEIGAFVGVGTAKLASIASKSGKTVYSVDVFDPASDDTECDSRQRMSDLYSRILRGEDQWRVYQRNIRRYAKNIVTFRCDSKRLTLPTNANLCFAFIDGNHEPSYVRNDFLLAWSHLVPNGVVGFDDYGHDLPSVTTAIDRLLAEYQQEIAETWRRKPKEIFVRRRERA